MTKIKIIKANASNLDEIAEMYDKLCEYLLTIGNPPGWEKGRYPIREVAQKALDFDTLYTAINDEGKILASMSIDNNQPAPYGAIDWKNDYSGDEVVVFHTLVVHPDYNRSGYGRLMVDFAIQEAKNMDAKCIRFDTFRKNIPAQKLYISAGFTPMGQVDLKMLDPNLDFYETFQLLL